MSLMDTSGIYSKWIKEMFGDLYTGRLYQTARLAVVDTLQAVFNQCPHKVKIASLNAGNSLFNLADQWIKRNNLDFVKKETHENTLSFLESLSYGEVMLVVWFTEHELTGEKFYTENQIAEIENTLHKKRIFSLRVSQRKFCFQPENEVLSDSSKSYFWAESVAKDKLTDQAAHLTVPDSGYLLKLEVPGLFASDISVSKLFLGSKTRLQFFLDELQNIEALKYMLQKEFDSYQEKSKNNKYSLIDLELKKISFFEKYLNLKTLEDRQCLILSNITGALLKQALNLTGHEAFAPSELPFWETKSWSTWIGDLNVDLSSLIILNNSLFIQRPQFEKQLVEKIKELSENSSWTV